MGLVREIAVGVLVGVIVNFIVVGIPFLINYFGVEFPFSLLLLELPIWVTLVIIIILIPTIVMYMRAKYTSGYEVLTGRRPPEYVSCNFVYNAFGVKWRCQYGKASPLSDLFYAYCQPHPYCPECDYEMEPKRMGIFKRYYWKCYKCGKTYKCPVNPYDAKTIIERVLESDIRSGKVKLK